MSEMGKRSKFQYRARGKRRKPFRFLGPEQRLREQVEKIAWCRRRVAVESARLNKMLAENPELRAEQDVPSRPTLVVDNTRSRPPRRRLGGSGPHAA